MMKESLRVKSVVPCFDFKPLVRTRPRVVLSAIYLSFSNGSSANVWIHKVSFFGIESDKDEHVQMTYPDPILPSPAQPTP